jgi:hypothetical protein
VIYDPLLEAQAGSVIVDPLADTLSTSVQSQEQRFDIVVEDTTPTVLVDNDRVTVVSVGEVGPSGPPGPQGPQGPPGEPGGGGGGTAPYSGTAPVTVDNTAFTISLVPGTINGQGLLWNGFQWEAQPVVPAGGSGTVPFKGGDGFAGDGTHFRYDINQQSLQVPKLNAALLDGGNF